MRSLLPLRWLLALLLSLGSLSAARASHLMGGDIAYTSVASTTAGVPRYHVVLRRFVNPGSDGGLAYTLTANLGSCGTPGAGSFSVTAPRTQLLDGYTLTCTGNSAPAYQIAINEVDINLPAGVWTLSFTESARSVGVQNVPSSGAQYFYVSAMLDNSLWTQDASPKFESAGMGYINPMALTAYSRSTFDADGDSLRYELTLPANACGSTVAGATLPPHFGLNPATGHLTPTASSSSTQGVYNITVRVSEYRRLPTNRWALIGYVTHESLYTLYPSTNQPPTFTTMQVNGGALLTTNPPIAAQPGQTVSVALQATDPDAGQTLRFASEAPIVVPGLSMARIGTTNGVLLTWQVPATLPPGRYAIAVGVLDNGCPYNGSEERTLVFVVGNAPLAARAGSFAATEVYPTPFHEQVQFKTAPNQVVVLFDALGREVTRLSSAADGLVRWQPAPALPAGLYFARSAADGQPLARLLRAE